MGKGTLIPSRRLLVYTTSYGLGGVGSRGRRSICTSRERVEGPSMTTSVTDGGDGGWGGISAEAVMSSRVAGGG